jgi:hypothetical protein
LKVELEAYLDVDVKEPGDVTKRDLERSSLILVDYHLAHWPGRQAVSELALKPKDGLALAAVLRSHRSTAERHGVAAFGLLSGKLGELAGGLPPVYRQHSIAHSHDLEWVFAKTAIPGQPSFSTQVLELARAVRRLPQEWPREDVTLMKATVARLMGLRKSEIWYARAWEDIEGCHPPFHELATATHGLAFLRWLLQRILPFPCFLIANSHLAARLRVTPASLTRALAEDSKLRARLKPVRYSGVLAAFAGGRWWRAGVEGLLWKITKRRPFDRSTLTAAVQRLSGRLEPVALDDPVVCIDDRYTPHEELSELKDAVEIQPDDWPPYADHAWVRLKDMRDNTWAQGLVVARDRDRVEAEEGE